MKQLVAFLFIAGAFVVGSSASAGPENRVWICHYPSTHLGEAIEVSTSAWRTSPHSMHGDCLLTEAEIAYDDEGNEIGCYCVAPEEEPVPEEPAPAPSPTEPVPN